MQPRTDWRSSQMDALIVKHRDPRQILCEIGDTRLIINTLYQTHNLTDAQHIALTDAEEQMTNLEREWMDVFRERMGVSWSYAEGLVA